MDGRSLGHLHDCELCGCEFRRRVLPHEDCVALIRCLDCIRLGMPCMGCGERSKARGKRSAFCKPCRDKRAEHKPQDLRLRMLAAARARGVARGPAEGSFVNGNTKPIEPAWKQAPRPGGLAPWVNRTAEINRSIGLWSKPAR